MQEKSRRGYWNRDRIAPIILLIEFVLLHFIKKESERYLTMEGVKCVTVG